MRDLDRRILAALLEAGALPGARHVRCERIVAAVAGGGVYDALVRMAQLWVLRYPLIDGKGNFGSMDADDPADMAYTAARLTPIGEALARAPADVPDLLINGGDGVPPHNLREVAAAVAAFRDDPGIGVRDLMAHLPGPDFPTGGVLSGARDVYEAGRGELRVRARTHLEGDTIVVTELPPAAQKGGMHGVIAAIVELNSDRRLAGLADLQDQSGRDGARIAIMLAPGTDPAPALETLFRHTPLETTFNVDFSLRDEIARFAENSRESSPSDLAARCGDDRRTTLA